MLEPKASISSSYETIVSVLKNYRYHHSISIIGQRLLITVVKQSAKDQNNNPVAMGGGIQNFLEVSRDGSFRYRMLLITDVDKDTANITGINMLVRIFSEIYKSLVGERFADILVDSEKCEKITVFRQFVPYYYLNNENEPAVIDAHKRLYDNHISKYLTVKFKLLRSVVKRHECCLPDLVVR